MNRFHPGAACKVQSFGLGKRSVEPILGRSCTEIESHDKDDMKRLLPLTLVLLALGAPAAEAKGISAVEICGASGCRDVDRSHFTALGMVGAPIPPPRVRVGWFRAKVTIRHDGTRDGFRLAVVPSEAASRGPDGTWTQMSYRSVRSFRRLAKGIDPYPASALSRSSRHASGSGDRLSRTSSSVTGDGDTPWAWITVGSLALATVAVGALALRRRRGRS
jgi:hypothetical protein